MYKENVMFTFNLNKRKNYALWYLILTSTLFYIYEYYWYLRLLSTPTLPRSLHTKGIVESTLSHDLESTVSEVSKSLVLWEQRRVVDWPWSIAKIGHCSGSARLRQWAERITDSLGRFHSHWSKWNNNHPHIIRYNITTHWGRWGRNSNLKI